MGHVALLWLGLTAAAPSLPDAPVPDGDAERFDVETDVRGPRLVVEVLGGPGFESPAASAVAEAVRLRLERTRGLLADRPPPPDEIVLADRSVTLIEDGLRAFSRLDLAAAEPALEQGLTAGFLALDGAEPPLALVHGAFIYGAVALYEGRDAEARARFALAAELDASYEPRDVPDHVVARYRTAVVAPRGRGTLAIGSSPPAELFVNGKPRGRTPQRLDLPEGSHMVTLRAPRAHGWSRIVSVLAGATTPESARLERKEPVPPAVSVAEAATLEGAAAAAARLGRPYLLALRPLPGGGLGGAWVPPVGEPSLVELPDLPADPRAAAEQIVAALEEARPEPSPPKSEAPWWPWLIAGGAVLTAVAVGLVAAVQPDPAPPSRFPVLRF